MKLEKAIELLELDIAGGFCLGLSDREDAERLGVEALEREVNKRAIYPNATFQPLPSETKE
jgi:hypothetical protein